MSMSRKIYAVILMMLLVAVVVFGVGFFSIRQLVDTNKAVERVSKRALNLTDMVRIAYMRIMAIQNIMYTVDDTEMEKYTEKDLNPTAAMMDKEIASYLANCPQPVPAANLAYVEELKRLWKEFVEVSNEVVSLTRQNPNARSQQIFDQMESLWGKVDQDMGKVANEVLKNSKQSLIYVPKLLFISKELPSIRMYLARYIVSSSSAEVDDFGKKINDLTKNSIRIWLR